MNAEGNQTGPTLNGTEHSFSSYWGFCWGVVNPLQWVSSWFQRSNHHPSRFFPLSTEPKSPSCWKIQEAENIPRLKICETGIKLGKKNGFILTQKKLIYSKLKWRSSSPLGENKKAIYMDMYFKYHTFLLSWFGKRENPKLNNPKKCRVKFNWETFFPKCSNF